MRALLMSFCLVAGVASVCAQVSEVYVDAADGGRHAVVDVTLDGSGGGERLRVTIRPHGSGVESEGGWRSRAGFNAHTAREMEAVLRVDGFEARMRAPDGSLRPAPVVWQKSFAAFPQRRLRFDRSIDYQAWTVPLVSELSLQTTGDLSGSEAIELLARGEPRLRIEYDVAAGRVTGLRMPGHSPTVPVELLVAEQEEAPIEPLDVPGDWMRRDREGKWGWYRAAVGDDPALRARFVAAMEGSKDWMFLEQVALYSQGAFGTDSIGVILHEHRAPNWRRLAGWFALARSGHSGMQFASLLGAEGEKAQSLGWLDKHADRLDDNLRVLQAQWTKEGVIAVEPQGDLPPWTEEEIFADIDLALGEREEDLAAGTIGKVVRGIGGWVTSERWGSPWGDKVVELIGEPEWRIAQAACLAFAHGGTRAVPMTALWEVAQDDTKDQRLREAAFLGWSYGSWGEVFKTAHEILEQPDHALWKPAVSRLGELGNGWTEHLLAMVAGEGGVAARKGLPKLDGEQQRLLGQELALLRQRRGGKNDLSEEFEAAAWMSVLGYRRSGDMEDWMLDTFGTAAWDTEGTRKHLANPRGWDGDAPPAEVAAERIEVRQRLIDELEYRWGKRE